MVVRLLRARLEAGVYSPATIANSIKSGLGSQFTLHCSNKQEKEKFSTGIEYHKKLIESPTESMEIIIAAALICIISLSMSKYLDGFVPSIFYNMNQ